MLLAISCGACVTSGAGDAKSSVEIDRAYLRDSSDKLELELRTRGLVYEDTPLQRYLEEFSALLAAQSTPRGQAYRVAVLRDPGVNAVSLPNGGIYLSAGILASLEDESQLALVIGHEMSHVASEDALASRSDRRSKTIAAKVTGIALGPFADLSDLGFAAALAGHSREQEEAADREAMGMIARAGFATESAPGLFLVLNAVPGSTAIAGPWNDHPGNLERQSACAALITSGAVASNPAGRNDAATLKGLVEKVTIETVRLRVAEGQYELALADSQRAIDRYGESAALRYYQGESQRQLRNAPLDAEKSFRRAIELDPSHGPARRGLAQVLWMKGDPASADATLTEYLTTHPDGPDARLIERMRSRIRADESRQVDDTEP